MTKAGRWRWPALGALFVGGGMTLLASTQPWYTVTIKQDAATETLDVIGSAIVPGAVALGYVLVALVGAMLLTSGLWRTIFGAVGIVSALGLAVITGVALADPIGSVQASVTKATGIAGLESVTDLIETWALTVWPAVSFVGAALAVAGAIVVLATARRWPTQSRRYEKAPSRHDSPDSAVDAAGYARRDSADPIEEWDALSHGEDPTR